MLGEAGALYAFVQDEDRPERFERRPLVTGVANDRYAEVVDGLFPGERVVSEGNYSLQYLTPVAEDEHEETAPTALVEPGVGAAHEGEEEPSAGRLVRGGFSAAVLLGGLVVLWRMRERARSTQAVH